jgi:uncharacterized protein
VPRKGSFMRLLATAAALAAALAAAPLMAPVAALAQDNAAPPAQADEENFPPSHLAAAQEVIRLTESDVIFDDVLPRLAEQTRDLFIRSNPALTVEIEDTVNEVALSLVGRRIELSKQIQAIWARRFTEAELNELATFFGSPTGKKFVENSPTISALSIGAARQWEAILANVMVENVRTKMREKGFSL